MKSLFVVCLTGLILLSTISQAQWVQTNGQPGGSVCSFVVSGANLFAGTIGGGVFLSTNDGMSWTTVNTGLTNTIVWALAVSPNGAGGTTVFAGTNVGVFSSTNNGATWTTALMSTLVRALVVSPNGAGGTNLFAGTEGGGIFRSTDEGTSWTAVNSGLTNTFVFALAVSNTNIFAGTSGGGVFLSTNNGSSWTAINTGITNLYVSALAVSPNGVGGTNLFAGTDSPPGPPNGIFLSTDLGTNWTAVLMSTGVSDFAVSGTNCFVGTYGGSGVRLSTNNGTSWQAANAGLTNPFVSVLAISNGNLFSGNGGGGGVWRRPLSEMITSVEMPWTDVPGIFSLGQNYPNPFNPDTKIGFGTPASGFTSLKVYDVLGREVAVLVNEKMGAGHHVVPFNAGGLPSGVYIYRIETEGHGASRKMLLLK